MDWFSWLSKTGLDPSLTYEYSLAFARNELQLEDVNYFNHEFLQSMGISIAKHRLEILKLASKENGGKGPKSIAGVIVAITKTKKCIKKCLSRLVFTQEEAAKTKRVPELLGYHEQWRSGMLRVHRNEELKEEKPRYKPKKIALSGPLDGLVHEKLAKNRNLKLSGPLDGRFHDKMMYTNRSPFVCRHMDGRVPEKSFPAMCKSPRLPATTLDGSLMVTSRSPRISGPLDGRVGSPIVHGVCKSNPDFSYDDQALWATLFQDMKPT